ncbi:hypothetical protein MHU86_17026 [Fragilaria crotonensis]|nr:hypothetical protein MHU86_17026 [Fragilaria crotonensis]
MLVAAVVARPQITNAENDFQKSREPSPETRRGKPQQLNQLQFVPLAALIHWCGVVRNRVEPVLAGIGVSLDSIDCLTVSVKHRMYRIWNMLTNPQFSNASMMLLRYHNVTVDLISRVGDISANRGSPSPCLESLVGATTGVGNCAANQDLIEKSSRSTWPFTTWVTGKRNVVSLRYLLPALSDATEAPSALHRPVSRHW